jgi:hypothetical protein
MSYIIRAAGPLIEANWGWRYIHEARYLNPPNRLISDIRFVEKLDYWGLGDNGSDEPIYLATLPAVVAIIRDVTGDPIGISQTYLDPDRPVKWTPIGSPRNSAKKIRGRKHGGMIRLGPISETIAIAEGWENALAWWQCGAPEAMEGVMLAAAVDLGNLAGRATGAVPHPILRDANGRPLRISNGKPDPNGPGVILPDGIKSVILIGDRDSETFATVAKVKTAATRFRAKGLEVALSWPLPGKDFNQMLLDGWTP